MSVEIANSLTVCPKAEAASLIVCTFLEIGIAKLGKIEIGKSVKIETNNLDVKRFYRYFV